MQTTSCYSYKASGKGWPSPHCLVARHAPVPASRSACLTNPFNKVAAQSAAVETASAPVVQATNEQPPCLNFTDVNRHNFKAVLPIMRAAIQEATFVAIDAEFTGLHPDDGAEDPLDDYEERYKRLLSSADNFLICQFGLSAFKWHAGPGGSSRGGGHWEAKTFNAYVFPRPDDKMGWDKRFLCQASSLSYLADQGFDFTKMIRDGIGFVPLQVRDAKVRSLREGLREELSKTQRARELRGPEEEELVEGARRRALSWLLGGERELVLPLPRTRRLRTLLRLLLQDEFQLPSLGYDPFAIEIEYCEETDSATAGIGGAEGGEVAAASVEGDGATGTGGSGDAVGREKRAQGEGEGGLREGELSDGSDGEAEGLSPGILRLRRLDYWRPGNLIASGQQLTPKQRIEMMVEQSGFSQVLEVMRDAGRPLVGHNATFDLAYTLSQFNGSLPRSWRSYKAALQRTFPGGLYDTKHIAMQLAAAGVPVGETGLAQLYRTMTDEGWLRANVPGAGLPASMGGGLPEIRHAPGFGVYAGASTDKAHEAGFDAFMTGAAFARLLRIVAGKAALHNGGGDAVADPGAAITAAATTSGSDEAAATAAVAESLLQPLGSYRGRVHVMRSDLPYADMYGNDPVPSRPAVLHVSGFGGQTRAPYLLQRFASMGFPPVQVCMLTAPNGTAVGALVQLARADLVPRAMAVVRKRFSDWSVVSFAEYYQNRQQQEAAASTTGGARAAPRFIRTAAGGQQPQQQRGNGGAAAASAGPRWHRRSEGGGGGAALETGAASGSSAEAGSGEQQQQAAAAGGNGVVKERQRLQAFTQKVAAVSGTLQARSSQKAAEGLEVAASGVGPGRRGEDAAEPSTSGGVATEATASAMGADGGDGGEEVAQADIAASKSGSETSGADGIGAAGSRVAGREAIDAEAAQRAAERLRSLAAAAERLKSWPAKGEPSGGAAAGNGGLALQRPGRPSR